MEPLGYTRSLLAHPCHISCPCCMLIIHFFVSAHVHVAGFKTMFVLHAAASHWALLPLGHCHPNSKLCNLPPPANGSPEQDSQEQHQHQEDHEGHQAHEGHEAHGHEGHEGHQGHQGHEGHEGSHSQEQGQDQDPGHASTAANTATVLAGHLLQCQALPVLALGVQAVDIRQLHQVWQAMGPELAHHQAQCVGPSTKHGLQPSSGHFSRHQLLQQSFEEEKMVAVSFGL